MKKWISGLLFLSAVCAAMPALASGPFHVGFNVGMGLPRVPLAVYRPPVALTGGVFAMARINRRVGFQFTANSLHAFSMGNAGKENEDLKFNTHWMGADLMVQWRGFFRNESFFLLGYGRYDHEELLEGEERSVKTGGLSLAMVQWNDHGGWALRYELRWHLLFEPDSRPQILTLTLGFML